MQVDIKKFFIFLVCILIFNTICFSQETYLFTRYKTIYPQKNVIFEIDSLSIIPNSVIIYNENGVIVDTSKYELKWINSKIKVKNIIPNDDSLWLITYSVFEIDLGKDFYDKRKKKLPDDIKEFIKDGKVAPKVFFFNPNEQETFNLSEIQKQGNISRGISMGNNQDVVVNSGLNLQFSGNLTDDIKINGVITDNNIPIQAEGTTQQLNEFDKVYVDVEIKDKNKITIGDIEVQENAQFLKFSKKIQGINYSTDLSDTNYILKNDLSLALSKGKYAKKNIIPVNGNQGPYKLSGMDNEMFVIILSGSERIYIDGKLIKRGEENDYVIDYNTGELVFTKNLLVNKEMRIIAEYEYIDKNYVRTMYFEKINYQNKNINLNFSFFSEQDSKNQPINQSLTDKEKKVLNNASDDYNYVYIKSIDTNSNSSNQITYILTDSLDYDSVLVYSNDKSIAIYSATFAYVGLNKGNYIKENNIVNGTVFRWVSPLNGVSQGDYDPIKVLYAPLKKQMAELNIKLNPREDFQIKCDISYSNYDKNTFSSNNLNSNKGNAVNIGVDKTFKSNNWKYKTHFDAQYINKFFSPIENFKPVEYNRDWNITSTKLANEYSSNLNFVANNKNNSVNYTFSNLFKDSYKAFKNDIKSIYSVKTFNLSTDASYLTSDDIIFSSSYLKYKLSAQNQFKYFSALISYEEDVNKILDSNNILNLSSFRYNTLSSEFKNSNISHHNLNLKHSIRTDLFPNNKGFSFKSVTNEYKTDYQLINKTNNQCKISGTYRNTNYKDSINNEDYLISGIEFSQKTKNSAIQFNMYYEFGSGMENKKEYTFIEVGKGKGYYAWNDYNKNGIKELNEFELTQFVDNAEYIKLYTPTNEFVKAYYNQYTQSINFSPEKFSRLKDNRAYSIYKRFQFLSVLRTDKKLIQENFVDAMNPIYKKSSDTTILTNNINYKNTVYLNRNNEIYTIDYSFAKDIKKNIMLYGQDVKWDKFQSIHSRITLIKKIDIHITHKYGTKLYNSEFLKTNNFRVAYAQSEFTAEYIQQNKYKISITYQYTQKENNIQYYERLAFINQFSLEYRLNILKKSEISIKFNTFAINYNSEKEDALKYEMLEGLNNGINNTWSADFSQNIGKNLQFVATYSGRKINDSKVIHWGSVQARLLF